jgi:hypothetical protein
MAPTGNVLSTVKGQAECDSLAEEVERIWRRSRPRLMRRLDSLKNVKDRTRQAARHCRETTEHLRGHGIPWDQANSIALYEWVYLPDIDAEDEVT